VDISNSFLIRNINEKIYLRKITNDEILKESYILIHNFYSLTGYIKINNLLILTLDTDGYKQELAIYKTRTTLKHYYLTSLIKDKKTSIITLYLCYKYNPIFPSELFEMILKYYLLD